MNGHGVDPDYLRLLGKRASAEHVQHGTGLTDAVTSVLRTEPGLTPEHVARVTEFANHATFDTLFDKSAGHKVVDFTGGPADREQVLRALRGSLTPDVEKAASYTLLPEEQFLPGAEALRWTSPQRVKVAHEDVRTDTRGEHPLRVMFQLKEARDVLYDRLRKQQHLYEKTSDVLRKEARAAIMSGHSPTEIYRVFDLRSPHPVLTKLALQVAASGVEDLPAVLEKRAEQRTPNDEHPLCVSFDDFVKIAAAQFQLIAAVDSVDTQIQHCRRSAC